VEIEILGNGGGLGLGEPTTSIRVGEEVLLDAGSGLETLNIEQIRRLRRVYLTHSHADHLSALPLLIETLFECVPEERVEVFGLPEVISVLRSHLFNGQIWPDFEKIPDPENGFLRFTELQPGERISDLSGFVVLPLETRHEVPSCGYALTFDSGKVLVFTGDRGYSDDLVMSLNELGPIEALLTECSYPNRYPDRASRFGHLTPELVKQIVDGLKVHPNEIWLGHFKPRFREEIQAELNGTGFMVRPAGFCRNF
jgi:ribonuclease BN (tRNA processing enzyme)